MRKVNIQKDITSRENIARSPVVITVEPPTQPQTAVIDPNSITEQEPDVTNQENPIAKADPSPQGESKSQKGRRTTKGDV